MSIWTGEGNMDVNENRRRVDQARHIERVNALALSVIFGFMILMGVVATLHALLGTVVDGLKGVI